jgi:hypothetical protein
MEAPNLFIMIEFIMVVGRIFLMIELFGEDFSKSAIQKQELPVAAMFAK